MGIEVSDPYTATEASIGFVAFAKPSRMLAVYTYAGSFLIAYCTLGGESTSKISSFLRPVRFETNNTAPHERHGTPLHYRMRPQVRNVRYGLPQFPIFRPNRQPMLIFLFAVSYFWGLERSLMLVFL